MIKAKLGSFSVNVVGDTTGEQFTGDFQAKSFLSFRDVLQVDKYRRDLLGDKPEQASVRAVNQAEIFAQLWVRLAVTPAWWKDHANGLDLADDNLIEDVFTKTVGVETAEREDLKKRGDVALAKLKGIVDEDARAASEKSPAK